MIRDMTAEELAQYEAEQAEEERKYWEKPENKTAEEWYAYCVNREIRKRYTASDEFAILRQRDGKPTEYAAYFSYCEECKALVKEKQAEYQGGGTE